MVSHNYTTPVSVGFRQPVIHRIHISKTPIQTKKLKYILKLIMKKTPFSPTPQGLERYIRIRAQAALPEDLSSIPSNH